MLRLLVSAIALSCTLAAPVAFAEPRHHDARAAQRGDDGPRHRIEDRRGPDRDGREHARNRGDHDRGWDRRDSDRRDWDRRDWDRRDWDRRDYRPQPRYVHRNVVLVRDYYAGWRPYPPGHARRWHVGYPLPPEVVYYELPPELLVRLEPVSYGHRYVRVDNDILTIVAATGLIVDILEDFGRG